MKMCSKCKVEKPRSEFYARKASRDGLQPHCKTCKKATDKGWYADNKVAHGRNTKAWRKRREEANTRRLVAYLLEHPCIDCGEPDPLVLDFDHRGDKKDAVTRLLSRTRASWEIIWTEIQKCDVRCANCHRRKTAKEGNFLRFQILMDL